MKRYWILLAVQAFFCLGIWAQSVSQISGTVRDASGLAVPGAQVTATQTDQGLTRTAVSSGEGAYVLPSLPVGPYRLEVKKEGFSTFVQSGIVLQVDSAPSIDPILKVGSITEQVQVEAAAAMVETQSTGVGQVVNQQQVVDLPLKWPQKVPSQPAAHHTGGCVEHRAVRLWRQPFFRQSGVEQELSE